MSLGTTTTSVESLAPCEFQQALTAALSSSLALSRQSLRAFRRAARRARSAAGSGGSVSRPSCRTVPAGLKVLPATGGVPPSTS